MSCSKRFVSRKDQKILISYSAESSSKGRHNRKENVNVSFDSFNCKMNVHGQDCCQLEYRMLDTLIHFFLVLLFSTNFTFCVFPQSAS